jgi:hypothetical protein
MWDAEVIFVFLISHNLEITFYPFKKFLNKVALKRLSILRGRRQLGG